MTDQQLYLAIGVPALVNTTLIGLLLAFINAKFEGTNRRFDELERRFDQRFNDLRDLWRSELEH